MRVRGVFLAAWVVLPALPWLVGCSPEVAGASSGTQPESPEPPAKTVRVALPVPVDAGDSFPSSLYVERDVRLTARNAGIIEQILVDRGDRVRQGQPLAVLETDLYARQFEMAEQRLRLARAEYKRARSLHGQQIVSSAEMLRREIERDVSVSELEVARAWLERCTIRAPFDGIVVERWAVVGQRVVEDAGTPIFRIIADDPLRARVDLPEPRLAGISVGHRARVEYPDGERLAASVVFVSPAVDPASGTAPVIVELDGDHDSAKCGASVSVRFEEERRTAARLLRVPREALVREPVIEGQPSSLFVARAGHAEQRRVEVVDVFGAHVTISEGIAPDDRIILAAGLDLSAGEAVLVQGEQR
jgi:RND family efflux transporter MFP subunit